MTKIKYVTTHLKKDICFLLHLNTQESKVLIWKPHGSELTVG